MIAARATRLITHFPTILLSRKFPVTDKADLKFKANGFGGNAVLFYFLPVEWQVCVLLYDPVTALSGVSTVLKSPNPAKTRVFFRLDKAFHCPLGQA